MQSNNEQRVHPSRLIEVGQSRQGKFLVLASVALGSLIACALPDSPKANQPLIIREPSRLAQPPYHAAAQPGWFKTVASDAFERTIAPLDAGMNFSHPQKITIL